MKKIRRQSTRDAFGQALLTLGKKHPEIVVVSADLASSLRVKEFARLFPHRFFEVGVAEQNAASLAAGLALGGKTVFLVSFACFSPAINWAQIRQSICLNRAKVIVVGSHGGLATGADGASHQALEDLALTRVLPQMKVVVPLDAPEVKKAVAALLKEEGPAYLRLHRPPTPILPARPFKLGLPQLLRPGKKQTLLGTGPILAEVIIRPQFQPWLKQTQIINCPTLKPLEKKSLLSLLKGKKIITLEDHQIVGGLGSLIAEILAEKGGKIPLVRVGVKDIFGESARDHLQLWEKYLFPPLIEALKEDRL